MDANYHPHVPEFHCALTVLETIMSKPSEDRAIGDAGRMSISAPHGNPIVVGFDDIKAVGVSAEHTILKTDKTMKIDIGDKIEVIPPYLDGTVKLHQKFYGIRKGKVEAIWKILGRDSSK
jgi:D-serine deaminase-like pyridoxal phosphate-dependent protein